MLQRNYFKVLTVLTLSVSCGTALATRTISESEELSAYKRLPSKRSSVLTSAELQAIPEAYPLFTLRYQDNEVPEVCSITGFSAPCQTGECKTQKGLCGETLSQAFFSKKKSWEELQGHINGNQGFDGFYRVIYYPDLKYVIIEDKAGESARLNSKTRQGSLAWEARRGEKISNTYNEFDYSEFKRALLYGEVVSFFTHTYFKDNRVKTRGRGLQSGIKTEGLFPLYSVDNRETPISERYTFATQISLLGSPEWNAEFQGNYISNYQVGIHDPIFQDEINFNLCPIANLGYCVTQDRLQKRNYKMFTETQSKWLKF